MMFLRPRVDRLYRAVGLELLLLLDRYLYLYRLPVLLPYHHRN
jgi:hypothetical protein